MWNVRANFIMSIDNSIVSIFHTHFVWIKCTPQNVGMFIAATRATHSPWMGLLSARCSTLWRINKATVKCMYATRESHAHFDKTITTTRNQIAAISAGVEFLLYHSNNVVHTSNPPPPPPPCRVNLVESPSPLPVVSTSSDFLSQLVTKALHNIHTTEFQIEDCVLLPKDPKQAVNLYDETHIPMTFDNFIIVYYLPPCTTLYWTRQWWVA